MNEKTEAEIGQTVYLRPSTKAAPDECYRRLAAVLVSYDKWPYVQVRVFDRPNTPEGRVIWVYRMNVGLHRTVESKKEGDTVQGDEKPRMVGKRIGAPVPPIDPESGYDQPVLF